MHSGYIIYFCDPIYLEEFWRELRDNVHKVPSQSSATQQVCDVSWSIRLNPDSPSRATRCPHHAHSFFLCIIQLRLFLPAGATNRCISCTWIFLFLSPFLPFSLKERAILYQIRNSHFLYMIYIYICMKILNNYSRINLYPRNVYYKVLCKI